MSIIPWGGPENLSPIDKLLWQMIEMNIKGEVYLKIKKILTDAYGPSDIEETRVEGSETFGKITVKEYKWVM